MVSGDNMKKKYLLLIFLVIFFGLVFMIVYNNKRILISDIVIENVNLPKSFDGFKICQISDLHNEVFGKENNNLITMIKKINPNIIVITGDLIDSRNTDINVVLNIVKKINEVAPVYFVSGNHEASIEDYETLKLELINNNVIILENKVEVLNIDNHEINLIGINDPQMNYQPYVSDTEIANNILKDLNYDKDKFTILLSHRPEIFDVYVNNEIDLILTGHAHGGQIRIPFIGGIVAPNQGLFPKYDSGLFKKENTSMYVSRGLGNSIIPFRVNNNPELVNVILKYIEK